MNTKPIPLDLAGFQLLCNSTVQKDDLLVNAFDGIKSWAGTAFVGLTTDEDGVWSGFRVYRKSATPRPGDTEKVPGTNITYAEQRASQPVPPHHSTIGCGQNTDPAGLKAAADEFRVGCYTVDTTGSVGETLSTMPRSIRARATALPTDAKARKDTPIYSGVLKYFPRALAAVAQCSLAGNRQHHPDKPLHWDMSKSTDEKDALVRHLIEAGTVDSDGIRHSAKVAWRALANLERELIAEEGSK